MLGPKKKTKVAVEENGNKEKEKKVEDDKYLSMKIYAWHCEVVFTKEKVWAIKEGGILILILQN